MVHRSLRRPVGALSVVLAAAGLLLVPSPILAQEPAPQAGVELSAEEQADALYEQAERHRRMAQFEKAAAALEAFTRLHPKDPRGPGALQELYDLYVGLGERAKARAVLERFEQQFRRVDPVGAARMFWRRGELLDPASRSERLAHARDYLRRYRKKGGLELEILANATIGALLWIESCPRPDPGVPGRSGCVIWVGDTPAEKPGGDALTAAYARFSRIASAQQRTAMLAELEFKLGEEVSGPIRVAVTGAGTPGTKRYKRPERCVDAPGVTVVPRDAGTVRAAQRHLSRALALYEQGGEALERQLADAPERRAVVAREVARARLLQADHVFEQFLAVPFPKKLNFYTERYKADSGFEKWEREYEAQVERANKSMGRIVKYLRKKIALASRASGAYKELLAAPDPGARVLATARMAMINEGFALAFERSTVPQSLTREEEVWTYCDTIDDRARTFRAEAHRGFGRCGQQISSSGGDELRALCDEGRARTAPPGASPAAQELYLPGVQVPMVSLEAAGIVTEAPARP